MPLDNHIPERAGPGSRVPAQPKELEENEVIPKGLSPLLEGNEDVSNKVSMSSTAQSSSIFERKEVLAGKVPAPHRTGRVQWEAVPQAGAPYSHTQGVLPSRWGSRGL